MIYTNILTTVYEVLNITNKSTCQQIWWYLKVDQSTGDQVRLRLVPQPPHCKQTYITRDTSEMTTTKPQQNHTAALVLKHRTGTDHTQEQVNWHSSTSGISAPQLQHGIVTVIFRQDPVNYTSVVAHFNCECFLLSHQQSASRSPITVNEPNLQLRDPHCTKQLRPLPKELVDEAQTRTSDCPIGWHQEEHLSALIIPQHQRATS